MAGIRRQKCISMQIKVFNETAIMLKQGYYDVGYVTLEQGTGGRKMFSFEETDGNYWETENGYIDTCLLPTTWRKI
jgi:hypothetical protein